MKGESTMKKKFSVVLIFAMLTVLAFGACSQNDQEIETDSQAQSETIKETKEEVMKIKFEVDGNEIVFELNDSQAAKDLYNQLPLTVQNEDFSNNEKTFYPPQKLNTSNAPATDGSIGTLAYYEPWGDVVLFYGNYEPNSELYSLGNVVSGSEFISEISGEMVISQDK